MELSDALIEPVAMRLKAIADPTRLKVLNLLRSGERSVLAIADAVGASQPNVSRHLALLKRAELVGSRKHGKQVLYRIVDPFLDAICDAVCGSVIAQLERQNALLPARSRRQRRRGKNLRESPTSCP